MLQHGQAPNGLRLPYVEDPERDFAVFRELGVFRQETVVASDGTELAVFEAGDAAKPTVLLINALGVSCLFLAKLAAALARDHHVLTWESRGLPDQAALADGGDLSIERHGRDAADVLERKGRRAEAIVAYCAGANTAVYGIANGILDAGRLCIISPSMEMKTVTAKTDYQRTMLPIWENVARSGPRFAALIRALIRQNQKPHDGSLESELTWLNNLPFRTDVSTHRYAQLQAECLKLDWSALLGRVDRPTLVLHGADDDIIHEETSEAVAAGISGASYQKIPDCGHFAVFTSAPLHERISAFLGGR